jgi:uncharacterized protein YjcR
MEVIVGVMMGSKYKDDVKEQALAMLTTMSYKEVSKNLNIPENTLRDWKKREDKINPEFVKLRTKKKEEFVNSAWNIIEKANKLIERKIERALSIEDDIDDLIKKQNFKKGVFDRYFILKDVGVLDKVFDGEFNAL